MLSALKSKLFRYPEGSPVLIHRLLRDYGRRYWKQYAKAVVWMVVGAACVSACAYLLGSAINQAYVARNFPDVIVISAATMVLFALTGFASYNQAVTMAH